MPETFSDTRLNGAELVLHHPMRVLNYFVNSFYSVQATVNPQATNAVFALNHLSPLISSTACRMSTLLDPCHLVSLCGTLVYDCTQ
jgi:hypothetical protein